MDIFALQRQVADLERRVRKLEDNAKRQHDQIILLGNDLDLVNSKTQRTSQNLGSLAVGSQDVTLTWPNEWPDTAYAVEIELITGTAALGQLHATLKTKTTTDVTITISAIALIGSASIDVVGIRT